MVVNNLNELRAFLRICRRQGIAEISVGELSVKFGDAPKKLADEGDVETPDEPTWEQLAFLSATNPSGA